MTRYQAFLRARVPGFLLPLLLVLVAGISFLAGHYIGKYDAEKINIERVKLMGLSASADQLKLYGMLLERAHEGRLDAVVRMLEASANAESSRAAACLASALCAFLSASTPEAKSQLQSLVVKYSASSPGGNEK